MLNKHYGPILVHAPNWVGDHIMAFPFYYLLRCLFPDVNIHLFAREWVGSLIPPNIFDQHFTSFKKKIDKEKINVLRENNYTLGVSLSPSFRSIYLLWQMKIAIRIGYKTDARRLLMHMPREVKKSIPELNQNEHRSLSYIRLLSFFFDKEKNAEDYWQEGVAHAWNFKLSQREEKSVQVVFQKFCLRANHYWVICPGSNADSRNYPIRHIAKLIKIWIKSRSPYQVLFVGTKKEQKKTKEIFAQLDDLNEKEKKKIIDITMKTNLLELLFILKQSRGVLANDSGIAHLSFLANTPLVTFMGAAREEETLALTPHKEVLNQHLPCSPCLKMICPRKDFPLECLVTIQPEEVWKRIKKLNFV